MKTEKIEKRNNAIYYEYLCGKTNENIAFAFDVHPKTVENICKSAEAIRIGDPFLITKVAMSNVTTANLRWAQRRFENHTFDELLDQLDEQLKLRKTQYKSNEPELYEEPIPSLIQSEEPDDLAQAIRLIQNAAKGVVIEAVGADYISIKIIFNETEKENNEH